MDYYITYRNSGKPERTPIMPDAEKNAGHNVTLLKTQGATSVRVHKILSELSAMQFFKTEKYD